MLFENKTVCALHKTFDITKRLDLLPFLVSVMTRPSKVVKSWKFWWIQSGVLLACVLATASVSFRGHVADSYCTIRLFMVTSLSFSIYGQHLGIEQAPLLTDWPNGRYESHPRHIVHQAGANTGTPTANASQAPVVALPSEAPYPTRAACKVGDTGMAAFVDTDPIVRAMATHTSGLAPAPSPPLHGAPIRPMHVSHSPS